MGRMPRARTFTTSWCSTNSKPGVSRRCALSTDRQHKSNKQGPVPKLPVSRLLKNLAATVVQWISGQLSVCESI